METTGRQVEEGPISCHRARTPNASSHARPYDNVSDTRQHPPKAPTARRLLSPVSTLLWSLLLHRMGACQTWFPWTRPATFEEARLACRLVSLSKGNAQSLVRQRCPPGLCLKPSAVELHGTGSIRLWSGVHKSAVLLLVYIRNPWKRWPKRVTHHIKQTDCYTPSTRPGSSWKHRVGMRKRCCPLPQDRSSCCLYASRSRREPELSGEK